MIDFRLLVEKLSRSKDQGQNRTYGYRYNRCRYKI